MQFELLGDRYQLQDPIDRDGMTIIYRGRDLRTDLVVAIKVLRDIYSTDAKFVARFQQEAKAQSYLHHPNIVQVYDYGYTDGKYYIVTEFVEGTDLRRYLRGHGILDIDRAVTIAHDVALGLGAAHRRGVVHRSVKPQNILIGRDWSSIKLTDFGIAFVCCCKLRLSRCCWRIASFRMSQRRKSYGVVYVQSTYSRAIPDV